MSQKYRFKSLQISEANEADRPSSIQLEVFEVGETKTIDFILLNETRQNFAYSHYITSWIGKEGDKRVIKIFFATHLVTIEGYCLDCIYNALTDFSVKSIKANDGRYASIAEEEKAFVTNIKIAWKKDKEPADDCETY